MADVVGRKIHIEVRNNRCEMVAESDGPMLRSVLDNFLTVFEQVRRPKFGKGGKVRGYEFVKVRHDLYNRLDGTGLRFSFPRGLYSLFARTVARFGPNEDVLVRNTSTDDFGVPADEFDPRVLASVLRPDAPFDLREDQVLAVQKALHHRRGIIQMPTGSGKTEVMSAILRVVQRAHPGGAYSEPFRAVVIEPTDILVNKTVDRFNRYGLGAVRYKDVRDGSATDFRVLVAHPTSLLHDATEDPEVLSGIAAVMWDECQHCKCETWKALNELLPDCEYALGFSALAVSEDHIHETSLRALDFDEVLIVGATGPVIVNISPKYYIDKNILATPVVFQLSFRHGEGLYGCDDWTRLRREGIESEGRTELAARAVATFLAYGRRSLVLVGTKKQARDFASAFADLGVSDRVAVAFGAGDSHVVAPDGSLERYDGDDVVADFDAGDYSVLVSTSHLDEGVDLSNLDVAVLASGGKKDRRIVQRIGRALRSTKTGRYAYIVDFLDHGSGVLEKHSRMRMDLYLSTIRIPKELIHRDVSLADMESYFQAMEGIRRPTTLELLMDESRRVAGAGVPTVPATA